VYAKYSGWCVRFQSYAFIMDASQSSKVHASGGYVYLQWNLRSSNKYTFQMSI
jgi:hypothetical protein